LRALSEKRLGVGGWGASKAKQEKVVSRCLALLTQDGKRRKEEHKETRTLLLDIEGAVWGWNGIESLQDARLPVDTSWLWQAVGADWIGSLRLLL